MSGSGIVGDIAGLIYAASALVLPVLIAITFHEAAHGFAAWRLGDDTAYRLGRVTFNPLKHIDRFGTIILPALLLLARSPFLFGYAKPVPVRFDRLRRPRRDMVLVAAAGPLTNLGLAVISAGLLHAAALLPEPAADWTTRSLKVSAYLNLLLAVFNMLPLPPLDGGRVAIGLLPRSLARPLARLERHGMLILIGAIIILPMIGRQLGVNLNILEWAVGVPVEYLQNLLATVTKTDLDF